MKDQTEAREEGRMRSTVAPPAPCRQSAGSTAVSAVSSLGQRSAPSTESHQRLQLFPIHNTQKQHQQQRQQQRLPSPLPTAELLRYQFGRCIIKSYHHSAVEQPVWSESKPEFIDQCNIKSHWTTKIDSLFKFVSPMNHVFDNQKTWWNHVLWHKN